jgi:hypothetical protein
MSAARRLLVHAIDIRFGLDEVAEADGLSCASGDDLRRLSRDIDALCRVTEQLREALGTSAMTGGEVADMLWLDDEQGEAAEIGGPFLQGRTG